MDSDIIEHEQDCLASNGCPLLDYAANDFLTPPYIQRTINC